MCGVVSWVVGKRCLLWPVSSLEKTLLAFTLLHSILQYFPITLTFYICTPYDEKNIFFLMLIQEGVVGLHRTGQLQLLWHQWMGHRLGLLWYWIVCLGSEPRSFCRLWESTQVLHFRLFRWLWGLLDFFKGFLPSVVDIMVIWAKFMHSSPF